MDRYRRDAYDDANRQFDKTRRQIEDGLGMDDMCVVDGDCPGNPITECDHEGSMMNTAVGKCRFVWWFYLILILVALAIIGCILSCVCMPCCCLYECLRKLCCCCCWRIFGKLSLSRYILKHSASVKNTNDRNWTKILIYYHFYFSDILCIKTKDEKFIVYFILLI